MTLSQIADYADLIAALAIVISLGFVWYEVRLNRKQAELTNWRETLVMMVEFKARTNDIGFAALVTRGHEDYEALSPEEKLSFGLYLEQAVHTFGNFLKHNDSLPRKLVGLDLAIANSFHDLLTTPGGAFWWAEAHERGRFMPETYRVVDGLLNARARNGGGALLDPADLKAAAK